MRVILITTVAFLLSLIILMPPEIKLGNQTFYRPKLDFKIGSLHFVRDLNFKLGLDLKGGTHLVYSADASRIDPAHRDSAVLSTKDNIERRVNLLGVAEPVIQTSKVGGEYRLLIELPGVKDVNQALATIGTTALLEFREAKNSTAEAELEFVATDLTGRDLRLAQVQFNQSSDSVSGSPSVSIEFSPEGRGKFAEITKRNVGKPLAIFLDEYPITAPIVREPILDGRAIISGDFTLEEAKRLSIQLTAGALPVPIKVIEQKNIGATLGSESVLKSMFAGGVGLVLIWLFMILNYGLKGVIADIALALYILISLSIFKLVPVTLTMAGIAGFILSVGVAVDASILIFERMKEEIRWGRPKRVALELAFQRAWTSVRDSNISSIVTACILFWFGTGSVRGFALTLLVGIIVSLFTSLVVTRNLMRLIYSGSKK